MSVDVGVRGATRSSVVSVRDVTADDPVTWDDSSSDCVSEQDEGCEGASTRKMSEISTGVLQLVGTPSNIHMENSSDVHIGSRLNYNAPVTINQCVHVLANSDVINDGVVMREAIRGPVHLLDSNENTSQATLINLQQRVQGTSSLYEGPRQLPTDVTTTWNKLISFCHHRRVCVAVILLLLLMLILLVTLIVYFTHGSAGADPERIFPPPPEDPEPNPNTTLPGGHLIYSKEDWNGQPPKYTRPLRHPTPFVVISHTASDACFSPVTCSVLMRNFQDLHVGRNDYPDIGYNFVVGGDGNVYEGRGWDVTNMHTGFVRRCNIAISFIGNFVHDAPTNGQIEAVKELIELGMRLGKVPDNYKLVAMNDTYPTESPGVVLYSIISKWPNFWAPKGDDIGKCPYIV